MKAVPSVQVNGEKAMESGYRSCACRDCFEIAIGEEGAVCHECEKAGCELGEHECEAPGAYGMDERDEEEAAIRAFDAGEW